MDLPPAIPVISLPEYNPHIPVDEAMHTKPSKKGILLIWIALFRPKYSARIPDKTDPIGFVITPKLAVIK